MAIRENPPLTPRATTLGLYVHVPFCASTCDFCAFYQEKPTAASVEEFLQGIERERDLVAWDAPVSTVFWGGGTPGLLAPDDLRHLADSIRPTFGGHAPREWTIELAPASVTRQRLRALRESGITRISMGVQSFRPEMLEALGRQHSPAQVQRAYELIREVGFPSVNLDLMFALPGQTEGEWLADLQQAIDLRPEHLSTYCLTFEEDTALWVKLSQGRVKLDPEREAALYEQTWRTLAAAGFEQYEVSNFARPGHKCIHNVNTWSMQEWVGLGPSAASQHWGWRGANPADLKAWLADLASGARATADRTSLHPGLLAEDALIFGLRMNAGVDIDALRHRFSEAPWERIGPGLDALESEGLLEREGNRVRLTTKGRLLADAVGAELLDCFSPA